MKTTCPLALALVIAMALSLLPTQAPAQIEQAATVDAATAVLHEIMAIPGRSIPQALLANAQGIAIVPGLIKGGFIVGIRHGRGVIVARDEAGQWKPPLFIEITGASLGWQVGLQGTDLVLVFRTKSGLQNLIRGKITIGADVAAAAGPVGREASAATDTSFRAEILSYSRSRGLFAGLSLDGSSLSVDTTANTLYYQVPNPGYQPGQPVPLPPSAARLLQEIARYTATAVPIPQPGAATQGVPTLAVPTPAAAVGPQNVRRQLADASGRLGAILDRPWQEYLALPAEVYTEGRTPNPELLKMSLDRFNTVATDPRYRDLGQRPEFRTTWDLLKQYAAGQGPTPAKPLSLPSPPK